MGKGHGIDVAGGWVARKLAMRVVAECVVCMEGAPVLAAAPYGNLAT